jgi:hypothetical protein
MFYMVEDSTFVAGGTGARGFVTVSMLIANECILHLA